MTHTPQELYNAYRAKKRIYQMYNGNWEWLIINSENEEKCLANFFRYTNSFKIGKDGIND